MDSFQAKIGWERPRKRENKKKSFRWVPNRPLIENSENQQKNSKNQKSPSQLLFKPKQVGKGREREKIKKNRFDEFLPHPKQKIPKKKEKSSKT